MLVAYRDIPAGRRRTLTTYLTRSGRNSCRGVLAHGSQPSGSGLLRSRRAQYQHEFDPGINLSERCAEAQSFYVAAGMATAVFKLRSLTQAPSLVPSASDINETIHRAPCRGLEPRRKAGHCLHVFRHQDGVSTKRTTKDSPCSWATATALSSPRKSRSLTKRHRADRRSRATSAQRDLRREQRQFPRCVYGAARPRSLIPTLQHAVQLFV